MSGREPGGVPAALRSGWRRLLIPALIGMALGFAWGIADQPSYEATATVVVEQPLGGEPDEAALERLAALGGGEEVATLAAGVLGGDVAGAELLSDVEVTPDASGATLAITATSGLPDFAAATANAFAEAMVDIAADRSNEAYRAASDRLEEKLGEVDPDSPEAEAISERVADLETARAIDPLTLGDAASMPEEPSENRPAALWALGMGLLGLLVGIGLVLMRRPALEEAAVPAVETRTEAEAEAEQEPAPAPEPQPEPEPTLLDALGLPVVAALADPRSAIGTDDAGVAVVASRAGESFEALADAIGLGDRDAPRTIAVVDVGGDAAHVAAIGLAVAVADLGMRVLVVDADLASPHIHELLQVEPEPGLADYLAGDATPRDVLRPLRAAVEDGEERPLVCVPAGAGGNGLDGSRFEALVERLPRVYDLVVFAGPGLLGGEADVLIALVDETVLLASASAPAPAGLDERLPELDRLRIAGVVATGSAG